MMRLAANSTLLCTGDSITDTERARPIGEDVKDRLGNGYVSLLAALLNATCPEERIRVVNSGVSGDTSREIAIRWDHDVVAIKPDWLLLMLGINDCCRSFTRACIPALHVSVEEYHATLDRLLGGLRPSLQGLVLLTPFYVEPNRDDGVRRALAGYQDAVRRLAVTHSAVLVDTQEVFDELCRHDHPMRIAPDRIHPLRTGHMALALAISRAIELTV